MAYVEQRERNKGTRYRGMYKGTDGRYRSAGTFSTAERALEVAQEAEQHAAALISGAIGGLDPATRATRTIEDYTPIFLRHHQVEGNTKDTYEGTLRLHVIPFLGSCRLAETDRTVARNYVTALQEAGRSANVIRQTKLVLGAMFTMAVSDGYLDFNPFHDLKIPKVPGRRAIKVAPALDVIRAALASSAVAHFDETGFRAAGRLAWVHSASSGKFVLVTVHARRGKDGMDAAGVLPAFGGIACHDAWVPYDCYDGAAGHALCNAHVLRDLVAVTETGTDADVT